jgi:hypothetical protein
VVGNNIERHFFAMLDELEAQQSTPDVTTRLVAMRTLREVERILDAEPQTIVRLIECRTDPVPFSSGFGPCRQRHPGRVVDVVADAFERCCHMRGQSQS